MNASPAKLTDGTWGAALCGAFSAMKAVKPGDSIRVTAKNGDSWDATVTAIESSSVHGVTVRTTPRPFAAVPAPAAAAPKAYRPRASSGRRTGCSCGSRERSDGSLIDSARNCRQCRYDGE